MRKRQTKEQAAEARAEYHELAAQASEIAKKYLAEHKDAPEGVVYGAVTGAACKYHANAKFRVQPFEVICLWWIRHRLLIHKSKQEDNMRPITEETKKKIIELRLSGVTNEKTAEITGTSKPTVGRIMREYRDNQQGFVDAGECTEEINRAQQGEVRQATHGVRQRRYGQGPALRVRLAVLEGRARIRQCLDDNRDDRVDDDADDARIVLCQ